MFCEKKIGLNINFLLLSSNMTSQSEILSEKQIIVMLQENNPLAWGHLYDKYAPAMYSLICNFTDDKLLAEEIFMNVFRELKQKQTISKIKYSLCPFILRFTHSFATKYLEKIGITSNTLDPHREVEVLNLLITHCNSLNEAASILNITVEETKKRLHVEFLNLRTQNNISANVPVAGRLN